MLEHRLRMLSVCMEMCKCAHMRPRTQVDPLYKRMPAHAHAHVRTYVAMSAHELAYTYMSPSLYTHTPHTHTQTQVYRSTLFALSDNITQLSALAVKMKQMRVHGHAQVRHQL